MIPDLVFFLKTTLEIFRCAVTMPESMASEKRGGYLTVRAISDRRILLVVPLGEMNPEKIEKYRELSDEKILRLLDHPEHVSSWQSRDPNNNQWGGAILVPKADCAIGFSGLPEKVDEAFVAMIVSWAFRIMEQDDIIQKIAKASQNDFIEALRVRYVKSMSQ